MCLRMFVEVGETGQVSLLRSIVRNAALPLLKPDILWLGGQVIGATLKLSIHTSHE
jgi:hypothetical protein